MCCLGSGALRLNVLDQGCDKNERTLMHPFGSGVRHEEVSINFEERFFENRALAAAGARF